MALEELLEKQGGTPDDVEKIVQAYREKCDPSPEQVEQLRASLTEAGRKGRQDRRFVLDDRPTSTWATIAFWLFMIALGVLLWLMASTSK
jgi:hypothetical protein